MLPKLGKANVTYGQLNWTDQFWPHVKYNRASLGLRYRDVWTWDCAKPDDQLKSAPKTMPVECVVSTDMLSPLGNPDRRASRNRFRDMRAATGFKTHNELDDGIRSIFGRADVKVPYDKLKTHFTKTQKIAVRMWVLYMFIVVYEDKSPDVTRQVYGKALARVSVPILASFEPFLVGHCNVEQPPKLPRKPLDRVPVSVVLPATKAMNTNPGSKSMFPPPSMQLMIEFGYGTPPPPGDPTFPPFKDWRMRTKSEDRLHKWRAFPKPP